MRIQTPHPGWSEEALKSRSPWRRLALWTSQFSRKYYVVGTGPDDFRAKRSCEVAHTLSSAIRPHAASRSHQPHCVDGVKRPTGGCREYQTQIMLPGHWSNRSLNSLSSLAPLGIRE